MRRVRGRDTQVYYNDIDFTVPALAANLRQVPQEPTCGTSPSPPQP
jgi:hypothetical protein